MPVARTAHPRLISRFSRLLCLLMLWGQIAGILPQPHVSAAAAPPAAAQQRQSGTQPASRVTHTANTSASDRAAVFLPIVRSAGTPQPMPTPTATPSATPTAIPSPNPAPTGTPTTPMPDTQPPSAPSNLRLAAKTSTSIALAWDDSTDNVAVAGYDILIGAAVMNSAFDPTGVAGSLTPDTSYSFTVRARDAAGNLSANSAPFKVRTKRADDLPYDPAAIAPPIDLKLPSDFAANTAFLYSGPDAIQEGVAPGTIEARSVAVLRGLVRTRDGAPLPGVTITVQGHPEFGWTQSRIDGVFDLAVNGGGLRTINYEKDGYLPVQRQIDAPWRDYAWLPDVALIPLDTAVTQVTLDGASQLQVARGSVVTDADGVRQATLLFPEDVTATMELADKRIVPLTTLHVRATEYTVGPNGSQAMPGPLPANSGYTYAVEFSVDEAIAAGAKSVRFSRPVINYVENFLRFPAGDVVPVGYYDRDKAAWIPSENGRVIRIVGVTDGLADIDISGDSLADDTSELGMTEAEREQLALLYPIGRSVWRTPISHFTPWDCNWPYGPPDDAIYPNGWPYGDDLLDDPCLLLGSIIECQNQALGEAIDIAGTPFRLRYQSDRVPGRRAARSLRIPVSRGALPDSLQSMEVEVTVAGQRTTERYAIGSSSSFAASSRGRRPMPSVAVSDKTYHFTWDGRDAYGRQLQGAQPAGVSVKYIYPAIYWGPDFDSQSAISKSFNLSGVAPYSQDGRTLSAIAFERGHNLLLKAVDARPQGLGGWSLDVHHTFDPASQTLYQGDGSRRSAEKISIGITTIAGACTRDVVLGGYYGGDGGPATDGGLNRPAAIAFGPDGSLYIADTYNQRVRRVRADGIISTVAGNGQAGFSGDGGPATAARLYDPSDVAVGPDGSIYIADSVNHRIRRVGPDGIISTVAGGGTRSFTRGSGPATAAGLLYPDGIAVGPDGSLYIPNRNHILRVGPDGIIRSIAGDGSNGSYGDGGRAMQAAIGDVNGIAVGPDGSLYIADFYNHRVRRITPDGIITTVAGGGTELGDGGPAISAKLKAPYRLGLGPDGSLYIADREQARIRRVAPNGIITTVAGKGYTSTIGDGGPAQSAGLENPEDAAIGPDGSLYIADTEHHCVRRAGPGSHDPEQDTYIIPAQDGRALYQFDRAGRHLRTLNALTNAPIYTFTYNTSGYLTEIADRDGRVTHIQRDFAGMPFAIVGPDGQRTGLEVDASSHLVGATNPAGETTRFAYTPEGLLTKRTDSRGGVHSFAYDENGRLTRDSNPAGGFTALSRAEDDDGYTVTVTNALGDTTTMRVETLPSGEQRHISTAPNGATTTTLFKSNGTREITDALGNLTRISEAGDPRWGMQAPFIKALTVATADGQSFYQLNATRTVALGDYGDPLSLHRQTETVTINGRTTTTVSDAVDQTIVTTDPAGRQTTTTLDAKWRPVREESTGYAPKQFAYDSQGRLISIVEGQGAQARTTALSYDANGYLVNTTDALGGTTSYTYDLAGRVLSQTLPTGHMHVFTYDMAGNRTSSVDPRGTRTTYEYDANNRLVALTRDAEGQAVRAEYSYDAADNLLAYVEDAGAGRLNSTTRYAYTPVGGSGDYAPSRMTDALGHETLYTYTPSGEVSRITDALGRTTVLTYTAQGWRSAVTTPGGRTTLTTYDDKGQVVGATDPRGSLITFAYDTAGRLEQVIAGAQEVEGQPALNQTFNYQYDSAGRLVEQRDPLGKLTTLSYDDFGRLVEQRDPLGNIVSFEYDALDRVVLNTTSGNDPEHAQRTAYEYDTAGRLLATRVDPEGLNLTTRYRYAHAGSADTWSLQEVVDPKGNITAIQYDRLGRRESITDALGHTWSFAYDNLGRPIEQRDPLGHVDSTVFDALGRRTSLTRDGRTERWSYSADGALAAYTDFMSRTTAFSYDADQRLTGVDYPAGTADVSYSYDLADNLVAMSDGLGTTTYAYDVLNRLRQRTRDGRTVGYDYAADDQIARIDYWGHGDVQYAYDDAGRLASLAPWGVAATTYTYHANGLLGGQVRGNGVTTGYSYDSAGRLLELLHKHGSTTLNDIRYTLDPNGNRTRMDDRDGATTFSYDAIDRLTQVSYPAISGGPPAATANYTFDAVGNRLSDGSTTFSYDASDRLAGPDYSYDDNGNLLSDGAATYAYDAANRLIQSVTDGITTTYAYDGNSNLVRESIGGTTTDFVLDERGGLPRILGEVRSDGTETLYAHGPDGLAAQQTIAGGAPQGVQYPLLDALGSLRHLTDASGDLALSRSYDAFGHIRHTAGAASSRFGFTGEPFGAVDGMVYLRARHYHPALGRFLQRDSFAGLSAAPQSLHRYAYANNNPALHTDPSGHIAPLVVLGAVAIGAVGGAAFDYGTQVVGNFIESRPDPFTNVHLKDIGISAAIGGVTGGIGGWIGPVVSKAVRLGSPLARSIMAGVVEGAATGTIGQVLSNLLRGCAWDSRLLQGLLGGALGGAAGGTLGALWGHAEELVSFGSTRYPISKAWRDATDTSIRVYNDAPANRIRFTMRDVKDRAMELAKRIPSLEGYLDVFIHSDGENFFVQATEYGSPQNVPFEVVAEIIENANTGGCSIRLFSCYAASGEDSLAQRLANELNRDILASDTIIIPHANGDYTIPGGVTQTEYGDVYLPGGDWIPISPQGR
jgi:RHS repeat-associated protein